MTPRRRLGQRSRRSISVVRHQHWRLSPQSDRKENLLLLSDWEENLLLLPVRQALGSANAGDGRRDCDDRIGNDAYCRKDDGDDSGGAYSVSSADARRSMMRRRWTLPLNVVADCVITGAEGDDPRSPSEPSPRLSSHRMARYEIHLDDNNEFR
jgi:hypothetical protein